jgi:hypothetical protein
LLYTETHFYFPLNLGYGKINHPKNQLFEINELINFFLFKVNLVWKRTFLVLGFSVLAVFSSVHFGFPGSGGLCTLVMAFLAGMRWSDKKVNFILSSSAQDYFD